MTPIEITLLVIVVIFVIFLILLMLAIDDDFLYIKKLKEENRKLREGTKELQEMFDKYLKDLQHESEKDINN